MKRIPFQVAGRLAALVVAVVALGTAPSAHALTTATVHAVESAVRVLLDEPDDGLEQLIDPNQSQGVGRVVLEDGHVDFGPTLNTGEWIIQIHDDTASPSYWRHLSDVVAKVSDASKLTVPGDENYAFLGLPAGTEAWVIPQVRQPGVVWVGWNTQEPQVLDSLSLGVTLTVHGVTGPGDVTVYLQSGNFGQPQPLWSTHNPFPQSSWIEVNNHTHANWVFSEAGIYLVEVELSGTLMDGSEVTARDILRFAVGDHTSADEAFEARIDETETDGTAERGDESAAGEYAEEAAPEGISEELSTLLAVVGGVLGAALVVALLLVLAAARRARKRARAEAWKQASEPSGAAQ